MLFIPIEPALYVALQHDMNLYNKALGKNIVLVSVTTLISTMRTVSFMWKQENQKNNVIEFLNMLEEDDDVQKFYINLDLKGL